MNTFLPINRKEMARRSWDVCDYILITGDAYVDHPSFGAAVISRILEAEGYRVGIISQPDWQDVAAFQILGKPRLGFLVTSGNMDSMVSRYTTSKKPRSRDAYSVGGEPGRRPDRALIVYTNMVKRAYKGIPVIIGGIEASLRRSTHYDYWSNKLRRSILLDSKADILIYGMGEQPVTEVAGLLASGTPVGEITTIRGTCYRCSPDKAKAVGGVRLPSHDECIADKKSFARAFKLKYENTNPHSSAPLFQEAAGQAVVENPPAHPLEGRELDRVYELPYLRKAHFSYHLPGESCPVPALREVEFSLASSRGCFGSCSFCALTFHQGRIVTARTEDSLIREAEEMSLADDFKGYIHDVGGPTANFFHSACGKQEKSGSCANRECLYPESCKNIDSDHSAYLALLRRLRNIPGIKKVFIRSGIRYDYLLSDENDEFLKELVEHHVSGQLKVAPEHASARVLELMGKPSISIYRAFRKKFLSENRRAGKKQYIIPYFISSHPGSTMKDAVILAEFLKEERFIPDQVQDYYPTPGTRSTCMYYTELDPLTMEKVHVPREPQEKAMQRALLHFHKPENRKLVKRALEKAGRLDLIGPGKNCLIR